MALLKWTAWYDLHKLDLKIATSTDSQLEAFSRPPHSCRRPDCRVRSIWCLLWQSIHLNDFSPSQWRGRRNHFWRLYTPSQNCYLKFASSSISGTIWCQEPSNLTSPSEALQVLLLSSLCKRQRKGQELKAVTKTLIAFGTKGYSNKPSLQKKTGLP